MTFLTAHTSACRDGRQAWYFIPIPRLRLRGHRPFALGRLVLARQAYHELAVLASLALDRDCAAMLLRDDVVRDRQTKAGTLAGRFGGEERLEQFVPDVGRN